MSRKLGFIALIVASLALVLAGCSGGGGSATGLPDGGSDGTVDTSGTVRVLLSDAPTDALSEVWVNILRVELVPADEGPVVALESGELPGRFELLGLADNPLELGVVEAPAGAYDQVRLVLAATGHTVVTGETEYELRVPSGAETGVKVNFPNGTFEVAEGQTTLLLDFLAGPSVHAAGQSGQWIMRPVINGSTPDRDEPEFGSIDGTVLYEDGSVPQPLDGRPPAVFVHGEHALNLGEIDTESGDFDIPSLLAGEYELEVGWLGDQGRRHDGELLIVTDDEASEEIEVRVEADTPLTLDLTVREAADDETGDDSEPAPGPPGDQDDDAAGDEGDLPPPPPSGDEMDGGTGDDGTGDTPPPPTGDIDDGDDEEGSTGETEPPPPPAA